MKKSKDSPSAITVFVDKVGQLTRVQRILICVVAFAVVGAGFFFGTISPSRTKIGDLTAKLDELDSQVLVAKSKADQLDKYLKLKEQSESDLERVQTLLPRGKELSELLDKVSKAGTDAGLEWLLFEPMEEVPHEEDSYVEMPVSIRVAGKFHGIASFFDRVARLPRIVRLKDIKIIPSETDQGGWKRLTAGCRAITYRFLKSETASNEKK